MFLILTALMMPPLLVFGLYHLLTWANISNINDHPYWKRVALSSALSHALLAGGFFIFSYFDYEANRGLPIAGLSFDSYLFNRSEFWRLMAIFDTIPMLALLALFTVLDRFGVNLPILVSLTIAMTFLLGTLQWYWVGGGIGLLLDSFWTGLKSSDEEDEDWL
jgi:hypothetical protein